MPQDLQVGRRAQLIELTFDPEEGPRKKEGGKIVEVQFNPNTLSVGYSNRYAGGDQPGTSGTQHVGTSSTILNVELLFDVTRQTGAEPPPDNVRVLTDEVNWFMRTQKDVENEGAYVPPGVRFLWGAFQLDGVMESMNETLEFFGPDGRPLRASVTISIARQEIRFNRKPSGPLASARGGGAPGAGGSLSAGASAEVRPPGVSSTNRTSVQQLAAEWGELKSWKAIAGKNDIDNPRAIYNANALSI